MKMTGPLRRLAAWLACFAVLLAALAPAVSHALAASKGKPAVWGEICSAGRIRPASVLERGAVLPDAPPTVHVEHCPFCATHGGSAGMPPAQALPIPVPCAEQALPQSVLPSFRPLPPWAIARARAPPQSV